MQPLAAALQYMDVYFGEAPVERLAPLLAEDCEFCGPFLRCHTAQAYLEALKADPPRGGRYRLLAAYEDTSSACLICQFSKDGPEIPMAQRFEVVNGMIGTIQLIFDGRSFGQIEHP